jgi:branched-chain amino acid transport system ATP-binding protein
MTALLQVRDVVARIGEIDVLHGITLSVEPGEAVCVLGPNGAGKTTLLRTVSGLIRPRIGTIAFDGRDIARIRPWARVGLGMAHVPQDRRCFSSLTVAENLRMGAYLQPDAAAARHEEVMELFPVLHEKRHARAGDLSGGQQQMLAIGRALMSSPRLLLLDEPTLGLAPSFVHELKTFLTTLAAARRIALVLVEQNVSLATQVCDRAYVLRAGRVVISGRRCDSLSTEEVADAYLGAELAASSGAQA